MIGQIERLARLKKELDKTQNAKPENIISIVSGKGGTGKSVFSLNLAYQLSQLGERVLLVDLDLNFSNLALMLNIYPEYTIGDYFLGKTLFDDLIISHKPGFDLIPGDNGTDISDNDSKELLVSFFNKLEKKSAEYDFIILDNGSGLNDRIKHTLSRASYMISVSTTEPTAVMDSYVMYKFVLKNELLLKRLAVINKSNSADEGLSAYKNLNEACNKFLKNEVNLLGIVSNSNEFNTSIINQTLLSEYQPEIEPVQQIAEIAKKIIEFAQMANSVHSEK